MTIEHNIARDPSTGAVMVDPETGRVMWPAQPDAPEIGDGPEQVYRPVPADWEGWPGRDDPAREMAAGWKPPWPRLEVNIRRREALWRACNRVNARRLRDPSHISRAIVQAAELSTEDPAAAIVEAIEGVALDGWCQSVGSNDSFINDLSKQLEVDWRQLCFDYQRDILKSLIGRDSPAANRLRAYVESLAGLLHPPSVGVNEYVLRLS